ncbi:MAG: hypothetical protein Q8R24_08630 [Legionellaceae bacterium]|nr:hypothetical protein [Legionellaceae bacterium]
MLKSTLLFLMSVLISFGVSAEMTTNQDPETIPNSELQHFNLNHGKVNTIINLALTLAGQHLKYQYGASNPSAGGMDCSGTIYYMLNTMGGYSRWIVLTKSDYR